MAPLFLPLVLEGASLFSYELVAAYCLMIH